MTTRKLTDWISTFIDSTEALASPTIFRRWTAISLLSAVLEQKVFVRTTRPVYPNQYIFLIAHPGVGKTRVVNEAKHLVTGMGEGNGPIMSPVSMTFASLVDALSRAKREVTRQPEGTIKYNSMYILADELGAFMHKYEGDMIDGLSAFYDTTPYSQERRTGDRKVTVPSPQLNILAGSTPQNLIGFVPDRAWGQGFMTRTMLIFSDQRLIIDDFAEHNKPRFDELTQDLLTISKLYGRFLVTEPYRAAVNEWKKAGEHPVPSHPRLTHYITRRLVHIYKLSMISSVNRDDGLALTEADFFTAIEWLVEAEKYMPDIFKAGVANSDSAAIDEIIHYIRMADPKPLDRTVGGVSEQRVVHFARERIPLTSILRIIEIMENSGQIICVRKDKLSLARYFSIEPSPVP